MCYWWSRKPNLMTRKLPPCYQEHVTKNCRKIGGGGGGGGRGGGGGGGGGAWVRVSYSTKFYTGRHRPEIQPLTLLYTIFGKKGTLFICTFYWQMVPLSQYPVQNFGYIHSLEYEWITKPGNFLDFITAINYPSVSHFGPFCRPKWQISRPFHKLQLVKFLPFNFVIFLKPKKRCPFRRRGLPQI